MSAREYLVSVGERSAPILEMAADIMSGRTTPRPEDGSLLTTAGRYELTGRSGDAGGHVDVSIVIPTFHRPGLLVNAVDSVRGGEGVAVEVVVVNDAEAPLPKEALERLSARSVPVAVAQHHRNLGLGAARNTGASLARGTWLMMLDDDDTLVDGGVAALLAAARAAPEASFFFGDHVRQWYEGEAASRSERRTVGYEALAELGTENLIICGSFMIRREEFLALNGYREDLPVHEDYNLHLRALSVRRPVHVGVPVSVYHCRRSLPRLNDSRLYWFATCAFNHAAYRSLFFATTDEAMKLAQREYQYAHVVRALSEGCPPEAARALIDRWWDVLTSRGLSAEVEMEREIVTRTCPSLA